MKPRPPLCEFCHKQTDHGKAEIEKLKRQGWTDTMPPNFKHCRQTAVPYCGTSTTIMWKPDELKLS